MSDERAGDPLEGEGQGGGTGGTVGNEAAVPGGVPEDERPPDADEVRGAPADEETYPQPDETGDRGFAGEDVGRTEDGPGAP